jgi:microcystin-dependent protein
MAEPFIAEIRLMSFNFAPKGWALCNGQLLPINQNQALFSLLGTTYGGNGQTTFALPDLRGRLPVHMGNGFTLGQRAGEELHTLTQPEMPTHNHLAQVQPANATTATPNNNFLGGIPSFGYSNTLSDLTTLSPSEITPVGGSQPHENRMPSSVVSMCIALQGIFPSQN